ncbi:putative glucosidase 2 subunit beta [Tothia fuscella]|uniref:Glucosidase 2 subunit beta n=1 Tax=Tothia fuscella TaxID=1048955 RepID=A0A9P4NKF3_9PEZI|nr:putative glucosidase 2 subunit beta [Tothia fuscella]
MKVAHVVVIAIGAASHVIASSESPRPRGVGPEFGKHYKSAQSFKCINRPEIEIGKSQVNDDYCDCPDGSDEPGTAACAHLNNTLLALPGYYCKNKGHAPSYVPVSYVNDGACDHDLCCDGSDEWAGVGDKCSDRCAEIGKAWRKQNEQRQKALTNAAKRRKELLVDAERRKKEVEDRIKTLKTEVTGAEVKVEALEKEFADIERREKAKVVKAPKEGGKIGVLVSLAKGRTQELRSSLERVKAERDDAQTRLKELEDMLTQFHTDYNPNFNDEGVKRAVKAWEDYAARDKTPVQDVVNRDLTEILKDDGENGLDWAEFEGEHKESDIDVLYKFEEYLPASLRDWVDAKLRDLRIILIENGILPDPATAGGEESKAVVDARSALDAARNTLSSRNSDITNHEADLTKDYGPDGIFRALKDQCISADSGEYEYELCWMGNTAQKSKKGHGNTSLGTFTRFDTMVVDEDVPADGRGLGSGERIVMHYENGQHCWNGPARSSVIVMACAEKDEIWKVVEAEKCTYRYEVGTAAVCTDNGKNGAAAQKKDEL